MEPASQDSHGRSTGEARTTIFQAESLMSFASMFSLMSFASMFFLREITQISTEKTHPKKTHSQTAPRFGLKNYGISHAEIGAEREPCRGQVLPMNAEREPCQGQVLPMRDTNIMQSGSLVGGRCCP